MRTATVRTTVGSSSRSCWSCLHRRRAKEAAKQFAELHGLREALVTTMEPCAEGYIVVVGACTGSDVYTVGIDAILNYKGYAGDKGLESYKAFESYNLGAQIENEQLAERALALSADAILVRQIITQRNCHKENALALIRARSRATSPCSWSSGGVVTAKKQAPRWRR